GTSDQWYSSGSPADARARPAACWCWCWCWCGYIPSGQSASEIADDVETAVRDGRLPAGGALPPVRSLAGALGLNPATVAAALPRPAGEGNRPGQRPGRDPRHRGTADRAQAAARGARRGSQSARRQSRSGAAAQAARSDAAAALRRLAVDPAANRLAAQRQRADGIDPAALAVVGGALDGVERLLGAWLRPGTGSAWKTPATARA